MSVFGGDSWGREAQHRKRRVDDLLLGSESTIDGPSSVYKRLSNGQFACLVCPQNPVLDSSLMFSTHCQGWRHRAAESKLNERESSRQREANKRIALADSLRVTPKPWNHRRSLTLPDSKPVTEQSRTEARSEKKQDCVDKNLSERSSSNTGNKSHLGSWERRERELKFTASGWKRDGHGKWYKDKNVEFDSDEEDPNECLA